MKTTVVQWGNSLAIRLPKPFAIQAGISLSSEVEMYISHDEIVVKKPKINLKELLKQVTSNNIHQETETGSAIGKEIW